MTQPTPTHPHPEALDALVGELLDLDSDPTSLALDYADAPGFAENRYRLGESLGAGAMGRVFRAWDTVALTEVALKVMHAEHRRDSALVARFKAESALLAKCAHPGVVRLIETGEDAEDGDLYFTMELMEGSLKRWLERPVRLERVVAWLMGACQAVGHAHSLGVIHGDLKASNLLLTGGGSVLKISDFSVAREIAAAPGSVDEAEDLRALGEVFYTLLTGQPPRMHCLPPSKAAGRPGLCDVICERAASANPRRRFASAGEMEAALARLVGSPVRRGRARFAAGGIAAMAVIGGVAAWQFWPTQTPTGPLVGAAPLTPSEESPGLLRLAALPAVRKPSEATRERPYVTASGQYFLPIPGHPGTLLAATETRRRDIEQFVAALDPSRARPLFPGVDNLDAPGARRVRRTWRDTCPLPDDAASGLSQVAAEAFCNWLTERETATGWLPDGAYFRLPWAAEWFAAGGGDLASLAAAVWPQEPSYSWGTAWPPPPGIGNFPGLETEGDPLRPPNWPILNRRDPFPRVAPVASFAPNGNGFYDLDGNLSEWACDHATATAKPASAHLVLGSGWLHAASAQWPYEPPYDYDATAADARGFRVALQLAPPASPLLHLTLHRVSDLSGGPHTAHPGAAQAEFIQGDPIRITWRVENHGAGPTSFLVRHNASAGGAGWQTVYRGPGKPDRPALGGGINLNGTLGAGEIGFFSFDLATQGWTPGPLRISSALHADTPDAPCLETSSPGAGLPWIPPAWWLETCTLREKSGTSESR